MKKALLFLWCITMLVTVKAQPAKDTILSGSSYTFFGDTLITNTGAKIIAGQYLLVGKGSGKNGWYEHISFKSAFAWPVWLFRDMELETAYSTYPNTVDASIVRERDKVKEYLNEGDSLLIKKIRKKGNRKRGYWYAVYLKDTQFLGPGFICNIEPAINSKEVIAP